MNFYNNNNNSNSDNPISIFPNNNYEIAERQRELQIVRKGEKMSNEQREARIKEIHNTFKNPTEQIMFEFPSFVKKELYNHKKKMQDAPGRVSPMIPIPKKISENKNYWGGKKGKTQRKNKKSKKSKTQRKIKKTKKRKTRKSIRRRR